MFIFQPETETELIIYWKQHVLLKISFNPTNLGLPKANRVLGPRPMYQHIFMSTSWINWQSSAETLKVLATLVWSLFGKHVGYKQTSLNKYILQNTTQWMCHESWCLIEPKKLNLDQWNIDMFTRLRFKVFTVDVSFCCSYLFQVLYPSNCVGVTMPLVVRHFRLPVHGQSDPYPLTAFLVKGKNLFLFFL